MTIIFRSKPIKLNDNKNEAINWLKQESGHFFESSIFFYFHDHCAMMQRRHSLA